MLARTCGIAIPGWRDQVHNRTPVLLRFCLALPSVEARGPWRERGRCVAWGDARMAAWRLRRSGRAVPGVSTRWRTATDPGWL